MGDYVFERMAKEALAPDTYYRTALHYFYKAYPGAKQYKRGIIYMGEEYSPYATANT